ncbi:hypothetical protein NL676_017758 [Syzygium grande]|nr:hypothetical protein NL676_017758 [Syzygium grande]
MGGLKPKKENAYPAHLNDVKLGPTVVPIIRYALSCAPPPPLASPLILRTLRRPPTSLLQISNPAGSTDCLAGAGARSRVLSPSLSPRPRSFPPPPAVSGRLQGSSIW